MLMETSSQYLLVAVLLLFGCAMGYSHSNINTDTSSLLALKSQIKPDPANILLKNWTTETSVCSWVGVGCDSHHHRVRDLNISFMGLAGTIPPEIGNLSFLVSLDMNGNSFHGPIPPSIFTMPRLQVLVLRNNSFSGSLPDDMCRRGLRSLRRIRISYNQLYGGIPSSLPLCSQLQYLSLAGNNFSGHIPFEIGNFTQLQELYLSANLLSGNIPSSICKLSSLEVLYLSGNNLEGAIPDCVGNFSKSLLILHLEANKLSGLVPSTFTKGCSLQYISLKGNNLEGAFPQSLINCEGLQGLNLGDNAIRDMFPVWMETLPELRVLVLRSNRFHGMIMPLSEHPFLKLQVLDISQNAFTGSLPDRYFKSFRGMVDMKENRADDEAIIFTSSTWLSLNVKGLVRYLEKLLTSFTAIDLSMNGFSGSIPSSIGYLNSLRYLNLSHNSLNGNIPESLGNISVLESLDLSGNHLSGRIPEQLVVLTFLAKLNLSSNDLVGQIPESRQFHTFDNNTYVGNPGLCGGPMTKQCGGQPPSKVLEEDDDEDESGFVDGFGWKVVALGCGCGFVIGVSGGYLIVRFRRPRWLVDVFFGVGYIQMKRSIGVILNYYKV